MADSPRSQLKKLTLGTVFSATSMIAIILTAPLEIAWLFYLLSFITLACILYAIPGYIGIWVWRMKSTLFRHDGENK